jgi:hypothetical protein
LHVISTDFPVRFVVARLLLWNDCCFFIEPREREQEREKQV